MAICPRCGAEATGNFCSTCGASLKQRACPSCGETPEVGARFCNHCGAALGAAVGGVAGGVAGGDSMVGAATGGPGGAGTRIGGGASRVARAKAGAAEAQPGQGSQTGWWVAGVFFVALMVIVALPIIRSEPGPDVGTEPTAPTAGAPGTGTPPDISQMTPREAADRLFNRVLMADESGDRAQVAQFAPMALQAYEMSQPLDLDGRFHVAMIQKAVGDTAAAVATAQGILAESPDYLLALSAVAEAAKARGDTVTARENYAHFLRVYDAERAKQLEEYEIHRVILDQARQNAVAATGGTSP
jgi:hypothetical protein